MQVCKWSVALTAFMEPVKPPLFVALDWVMTTSVPVETRPRAPLPSLPSFTASQLGPELLALPAQWLDVLAVAAAATFL